MSLPNGEDWLLQPVLEGLIRYESLLDGSVNLEDIALLNDALTVKRENQRRIQADMESRT
ncbi:DUF6889 family protein [Robbsia andropogonis]|uniref:DUF6889 family protein n=1 Tax=Robbsia andropogonis TaxID=28092 RepID=UPI000463E810